MFMFLIYVCMLVRYASYYLVYCAVINFHTQVEEGIILSPLVSEAETYAGFPNLANCSKVEFFLDTE